MGRRVQGITYFEQLTWHLSLWSNEIAVNAGGCNIYRYGPSGKPVPLGGRNPFHCLLEYNYLNIYKVMYLQSFVFVRKLFFDR
jgi:hypothetical protein